MNISLYYFSLLFLNMTHLPAKLSSMAPFQVGCCIYSDIRTKEHKNADDVHLSVRT